MEMSIWWNTWTTCLDQSLANFAQMARDPEEKMKQLRQAGTASYLDVNVY